MRVETRLPLGKLDPGVRATAAALDIRNVADDARRAEALGYDGIITEETKDDPYIVMALAAQATRPRVARHRRCARLSAQPDRDRDDRLDIAAPVRRPVHAGAGLAGQGPYRAALRDDLVGAGAVAARVRRGAARDLGLLAERREARFPRRALQAQSDGAAVHAGADRAPANPGRAGCGQPVYVPGRRRGRRRHPRPPDRDAALYRRDDAAGGAPGGRENRPRPVGLYDVRDAAGRDRARPRRP